MSPISVIQFRNVRVSFILYVLFCQLRVTVASYFVYKANMKYVFKTDNRLEK